MNTKTWHQSSLGRIALMLRSDLIINKKAYIYCLLCLFWLYILGRIPVLIGGISYSRFVEQHAYNYDFDQIEFCGQLMSYMLFFVSMYHRVKGSKPVLFSTLPAKLWEKCVSMLLLAYLISVMGYLAVRIEFLLEWLTIPNIHTPQSLWSISPLPFIPAGFYEHLTFAQIDPLKESVVPFAHKLLATLALFGGWASAMLCSAYSITRIQHKFLSAVALLLGPFLIVGGIAFLFATVFKGVIIETGSGTTENFTFVILFLNGTLWTLATILFVSTRKQLSRISS